MAKKEHVMVAVSEEMHGRDVAILEGKSNEISQKIMQMIRATRWSSDRNEKRRGRALAERIFKVGEVRRVYVKEGIVLWADGTGRVDVDYNGETIGTFHCYRDGGDYPGLEISSESWWFKGKVPISSKY